MTEIFEKFEENSYFKKIMPEEQSKKEKPAVKWLKRLGLAGFMFFFIKGLIWLTLFIAAAYFGVKIFE
jgi:hypothetical protein